MAFVRYSSLFSMLLVGALALASSSPSNASVTRIPQRELTIRDSAVNALLLVQQDVTDAMLQRGAGKRVTDTLSFHLYRQEGRYLIRVYLSPDEYFEYATDLSGKRILSRPDTVQLRP